MKDTQNNSSDLEQKLKNIWKDLLKIDNFSNTASFYDLGGTSLLLIRLVSIIIKTFNIEIDIADFIKNPTFDKCLKYITNS